MCPRSTLNHSKALEGVHGVHVLPHSPFAVKEITQHGEFHQPSSCNTSGTAVNQQLLMQVGSANLRTVACVAFMSGQLYCETLAYLTHLSLFEGDEHLIQTAANVLTSLPFIALGMQAPRKDLNTKLYANSLIGVGIASTLYHSSRGKLRRFFRWADYTMIATTSVCLSRALSNENPKLLMAASAVLLPIQPIMVSAVHTGMMEVAFAKRALKDPDLRMAHNVHKMASLLGGILFIADDVFPKNSYLHAAWHLAAAVGVGTCNKLLE